MLCSPNSLADSSHTLLQFCPSCLKNRSGVPYVCQLASTRWESGPKAKIRENACGCCETWGEQIHESVWCGTGPDDGRESEPYSAFPGASSLPENTTGSRWSDWKIHAALGELGSHTKWFKIQEIPRARRRELKLQPGLLLLSLYFSQYEIMK